MFFCLINVAATQAQADNVITNDDGAVRPTLYYRSPLGHHNQAKVKKKTRRVKSSNLKIHKGPTLYFNFPHGSVILFFLYFTTTYTTWSSPLKIHTDLLKCKKDCIIIVLYSDGLRDRITFLLVGVKFKALAQKLLSMWLGDTKKRNKR